MSRAESDALLGRLLARMQSSRRVRVAIGAILAGALVAYGVHSLYQLLPRRYTLNITGGGIVSNRHYLVHILSQEGAKRGLTLVVKPESRGALAMLADLSKGGADGVDVAVVQGGLDEKLPHIEHLATIAPEYVHLLVKPDIKGMADLKGKKINLGTKASGAREIGLRLTEFAGYTENVDYVEVNQGADELLSLPINKMPDAIITVSSVPSFLVELLVRKYDYRVVEIPFPESLALRHGWAGKGTILAYTYNIKPPVPEKDIATVAVNMHLLAHEGTDPAALSALLSVLYSPSVAAQTRRPIDEKDIAVPSGYPISPGMTAYLERNDSILTMETWGKIQGTFGLVMSFSGMGIVVLKWLRGAAPKPETHDDEFHGYLAQVSSIERAAGVMEASGRLDPTALQDMLAALGHLRAHLLERYPKASLKDAMLFDRCVASVRAAHDRVAALRAQADGKQGEAA
jgi:hypothetical protein